MAKIQNAENWGRSAAKERYESKVESDVQGRSESGSKKAIVGLIDQPKLDEMGRVMQAPQAVNDEHGANYDNGTSGWVRGMAKDPYPHFDHGPSGHKFGKGK